MDGCRARETRSRPRLNEATHVPPASRAESHWSLFIYFCSFLVLKIYDRTFATLLRLFTQANTSAEKMILVMKGLGFSHYSIVVLVCARGQLSEESATYWRPASTVAWEGAGRWLLPLCDWPEPEQITIWCTRRASTQECGCDPKCVTNVTDILSRSDSHPRHAYHLLYSSQCISFHRCPYCIAERFIGYIGSVFGIAVFTKGFDFWLHEKQEWLDFFKVKFLFFSLNNDYNHWVCLNQGPSFLGGESLYSVH